MAQGFCKEHNISQGRITIGLDGEQAIKNILRPKLTSAHVDYDLIHHIRGMIHKLPLTISWLWIRGHQDDFLAYKQLPFEAQQNVKADQAAKKCYQEYHATTIPDPQISFSFEHLSAVHRGEKITRLKFDELYQMVMRDQIIDYWCTRGNIETSQHDNIDWNNFGKAFNRHGLRSKGVSSSLVWDMLQLVK